MVLRNANKTQQQQLETRQAQLFMQIANQTLHDPAFMNAWARIRRGEWSNLEEFMEWRGDQDSDNFKDVFRVGSLLETIGVIVKESLVDIRLIDSLMAAIVLDYWEKVGAYAIIEMKDSPNFKGYEAEYLYNELKKYQATNLMLYHPHLA